MPELTITSFYVDSRVDSSTFTMSNPMLSESTLSPSQELRIWPLAWDIEAEGWRVVLRRGT
jgi:hypothetical protein